MKKTLIMTGVLVLALGAFGFASACDGAKKTAANGTSCATAAEAKLASADGSCATKTADARTAEVRTAEMKTAGCADKAACSTMAIKDCGGCPVTAAKAAYAATLKATGNEEQAKEAYIDAMAETVYANTLAEKHCDVTAAKAAYAYVKEQTGCTKSAAAGYQHAVAKAAYDKSLSETGCQKTADAAYQKAAMAAAGEVEKLEMAVADNSGAES